MFVIGGITAFAMLLTVQTQHVMFVGVTLFCLAITAGMAYEAFRPNPWADQTRDE